MDTHKRVLGILFTVTGALQIMAYVIVALIFSTLFPLIIEEADPEARWILEWVSHFGQIIGIILLFFFAIPSVIVGIGLLNKQRWMTAALILGCFKLFSFPIGTAIGIYSIWVFAQDQKEIKTTDL